MSGIQLTKHAIEIQPAPGPAGNNLRNIRAPEIQHQSSELNNNT